MVNAWTIPQADLTAWIQARSGELSTAVLDTVDDMVFIKDLEGRFVFNNAAHLAFLTRTREEVVGQSDFDLFPPEEAEGFFAHDTRVLETCRPVVSAHRAQDASGGAVIDIAFKHVVSGPGEAVVGLVGIVKRIPVGEDRAACREAVMQRVRATLGQSASSSQLAALAQSVGDLLRLA
jgi:PAS domain S-box-containing protein